MSTDLVKSNPAGLDIAPVTDGEINTLFRLADGLSRSGMFKDARQAEQAFAKLIFGRDLGFSATQAMTGIHIIEGRPEVSANLQAMMVKRAEGYDYTVVTLDEKACELRFLRDGEVIGTSTFSMQDAAKAGLAGKNNWKNYPRNMLFARALSNGVAWFCPEVTAGIRVYAEGEVREHIEAEVVEPVAVTEPSASPERIEEVRTALAAAGFDDERQRMALVGAEVDEVEDVDAALNRITEAQAEALLEAARAEVIEAEPVEASA